MIKKTTTATITIHYYTNYVRLFLCRKSLSANILSLLFDLLFFHLRFDNSVMLHYYGNLLTKITEHQILKRFCFAMRPKQQSLFKKQGVKKKR